jgi:hypothetical protein
MYVAVPLFAPVLVFTKLTVTGPEPQILVTEGVKDVFTCGQFAKAPNDQRIKAEKMKCRHRVFNVYGFEWCALIRV